MRNRVFLAGCGGFGYPIGMVADRAPCPLSLSGPARSARSHPPQDGLSCPMRNVLAESIAASPIPPASPESGERGQFCAPSFDSAAAAYPTRSVPVGRVIDLLRLSHRPDCVSAYRECMERGDRFPPIAVIALGGYYLVADGHKRLQAFLGLAPEAEVLVVECWPWPRWLRDQWQQFRRKQGQFAAALRGGPGSGRVFLGLISTTLQHWWRVVRSLGGFVVSRRAERTRGAARR
jgi:hypothetical protein